MCFVFNFGNIMKLVNQKGLCRFTLSDNYNFFKRKIGIGQILPSIQDYINYTEFYSD